MPEVQKEIPEVKKEPYLLYFVGGLVVGTVLVCCISIIQWIREGFLKSIFKKIFIGPNFRNQDTSEDSDS